MMISVILTFYNNQISHYPIMKTIKIFLASSEELEEDRNAFGNLIRRLDEIYEKRGIRIKLFQWEDHDAAYNNRRKQDEYNEYVRSSDMFLALFYTVAGDFTIEEFDIATEEFRKHASPKIYAYCKDLQPGQNESTELTAFKKRLLEEMGHYWCRYNNRDSMQLHFILQLQLVENSHIEPIKVENGEITFGGMSIARMDNLRFASDNEEYRKMNESLTTFPDKIENIRLLTEKYPEDENLQKELQNKKNEYNQLKKHFSLYQQQLCETAQRIAHLQGQQITDRMRRAIEAFNEGCVHKANIILDEAEKDADNIMDAFKQSKNLTEQKRSAVFASIDELQLKASTMLADISIPIDIRINQVDHIYTKAYTHALESGYNKRKYDKLLADYASFLNKYAHYSKALDIYNRLLCLRKELYGPEHTLIATLYNELGLIYGRQSNYKQALKFYLQALRIQKQNENNNYSEIATTYNNIGSIYDRQGAYSKALEYYLKSLEISIKTLGHNHPSTAILYNNIGGIYDCMGDFTQALTYYLKALKIKKDIYGEKKTSTAILYNNIGLVYSHQRDFSQALAYYLKALKIKKDVYGENHPSTATSYNNVGYIYDQQNNYNEALKYYTKALSIREKVLGINHPSTAISYNHIGYIYSRQEDYDTALKYYVKVLMIYEKNELESLNVAIACDNIGAIYLNKKLYTNSLKYYFKALKIRKKILGDKHVDIYESYDNIQSVYFSQGYYKKALEYSFKALDIIEKIDTTHHLATARVYCNIGYIYAYQRLYEKSLEYYNKALNLREKTLGKKHPHTIVVRKRIEEIKSTMNQ